MLYEVPIERIDEMADVCAEAFIANNDPIGNFIFQKEPNHLILKKRFFRSLVTSCSSKALIQGISPGLEAVSIWFPPGMDHSGDAEKDPFSERDFEDARTMEKMLAVNEVIAALTLHLGQKPQWYLHLVAAHPQFKGQGYASRLIKPMLIKAENDSLACTLITQSMENVRKYEHWGFKVVKEMPVPGSQEKFYSMCKD